MEAAHAMPLFAFDEAGLDPHLALAHRFGVGPRLVIPAHPLQIGLREVAMELPAVVAGCALRFEWTGIAGGGVGPVLRLLGLVLPAIRAQQLPLRTTIHVLLGVVGE